MVCVSGQVQSGMSTETDVEHQKLAGRDQVVFLSQKRLAVCDGSFAILVGKMQSLYPIAEWPKLLFSMIDLLFLLSARFQTSYMSIITYFSKKYITFCTLSYIFFETSYSLPEKEDRSQGAGRYEDESSNAR